MIEDIFDNIASSDAECREPDMLRMAGKIVKVVKLEKLCQLLDFFSGLQDDPKYPGSVKMTTEDLKAFCDTCNYSVCVLAVPTEDGKKEQYVGIYDEKHKLITVALK